MRIAFHLRDFFKFIITSHKSHHDQSPVVQSSRLGVRQEEDLLNQEQENNYTIDDYMVFAAAIADGLNWEQDYDNLKQCINSFLTLSLRVEKAWDDIVNVTFDSTQREAKLFGDIINKQEFFEMALALGNVSVSYKSCWTEAEESLLKGVNWTQQFNST